jgi:uncharacterized membrane protein YbhN (UPF0104 family)
MSTSGTTRIAAMVGVGVAFAGPLATIALARYEAVRREIGRRERWFPIERSLTHLSRTHVPMRLALGALALAVWSRVTDALTFALALSAISGPESLRIWLPAYALGLGATSLALTPGGLGTTELALATALTAQGVAPTTALAGAMLYRLISFGVIASIGWLSILRTQAHRVAAPRPVGDRRFSTPIVP